MATFSWLHLSDFHLKGKETEVERISFDNMISDIAARVKEEIKPDVIFLSGDISFSGQIEEFKELSSWLDKILEACNLAGQRKRIFLVPGNHDVDRTKIENPGFVLKQYRDFTEGLLRTNKYSDINLFLRDDEHKKWAFKKFDNYKWFLSHYYSDDKIKFDEKKYFSVRSFDKDAYRITIIGLNSAWMSFQDDEQARLMIGEQQVCDALGEANRLFPDSCLRIVMIHHPIYWMAEKDIEKIHQCLRGKCNLILRGHLHCPNYSNISSPDSNFIEFAAGASLYSSYQAYNLVRMDLDSGDGVEIVRLKHKDLGGIWGADDFTYQNMRGMIRFSLKPSPEKRDTGA